MFFRYLGMDGLVKVPPLTIFPTVVETLPKDALGLFFIVLT